MVSLNAAFFYLHNVGPICFAAIWLASARWVYLDARRRLRNPSGIRVATLTAAALPFLGAGVWACMRPGETLAQRRERRLIRLVLEEELLLARRDEDLRHVRQHEVDLAQCVLQAEPVERLSDGDGVDARVRHRNRLGRSLERLHALRQQGPHLRDRLDGDDLRTARGEPARELPRTRREVEHP